MQQQGLFDDDPQPWEMDDQEDVLVARVVFSVAPFGPYDYQVPEEKRELIAIGARVKVPLGRGNRSIEGYCVDLFSLSQLPPGETPHRSYKKILAVIDREPLITSNLLDLARWMSDYYMCSLGQTIETIVPAGVRANAGTRKTLFLSVPNQVAAKLAQLKLPAKQLNALTILASSVEPLTASQLAKAAECTQAPISALRKKGLVTESELRVQQSTHEIPAEALEKGFELNEQQRPALDTILSRVQGGKYDSILIHGATGSGKTEVYIQAIEEVIRFGRQAIVLVPEISLTPQTRQRFRARFEKVAVLHSHLSGSERHWHWQKIAQGEVQVIVGARSAIFAPAPQLGIVIIDEEHDASFKQDKAPRYHARDVAQERCRLLKIPLVLGSATPSLASWQAAIEKETVLVSMPDRVLNLPMPDVATIDLRTEFRSRGSRGAISRPLHGAIHQALQDEGQVILLLNRRGFATNIQCPSCGFVVQCPHCDISLTHHRHDEKAVCHYCDYQIPAPNRCPDCKFDGIRFSGFGTQKLEAEVRSRFPDVNCLRMDTDTMQRPGSHEKALARFRSGEIKVLLGTQMIAKGLDFPNVTLVGVINADTALHFPDFRASERTFGLVTQVAGRTGRGEKGGRVLVQTFSPDHPAILAAAQHDYLKFAEEELPTREEFGYPPFSRMARLVIRGPDETQTEKFTEALVEIVQSHADKEGVPFTIMGPAPAPISKLRGRFRFHALISSPRESPLQETIRVAVEKLKVPEEIQWIVDIDPLDML